MGAWGYGIRQDDFVCDVIGAFEDELKAGRSVAEATETVTSQFSGAITDPVDGPLLWIALAEMQWTYGGLNASVVERVRTDLESGRSLVPWEEDQRGLERRRAALNAFVRKIGVPNPRPKKPPKTVVRAPKFQAGDCLSINLPNGDYAAAIVLVADHSLAEQGRNLVAVMDHRSAEKPTIEMFRRWRLQTGQNGWNNGAEVGWYLPVGFRTVKNRIEVIGQVEILDSDPHDCPLYFRWTGIGERVRERPET